MFNINFSLLLLLNVKCQFNDLFSSRNNSLDRGMTPPMNSSILSAASSVSSLSMESTTSGSHKTPMKAQSTPSKSNGHELPSHINAQLQPNSPLLKGNGTNSVPDFYIIKVTCEVDNTEESNGVVLYKSIMLSNNERTPQVIRNAMMKMGMEGDPDKFTISQILPDKELMLPSNANVYYAVNTQFNLNFILRKKKDV
jgi:ral guanine nucleotide dissociation stimulator-like 1